MSIRRFVLLALAVAIVAVAFGVWQKAKKPSRAAPPIVTIPCESDTDNTFVPISVTQQGVQGTAPAFGWTATTAIRDGNLVNGIVGTRDDVEVVSIYAYRGPIGRVHVYVDTEIDLVLRIPDGCSLYDETTMIRLTTEATLLKGSYRFRSSE